MSAYQDGVGYAAFWMQAACSTQGSVLERLNDGELLEEMDDARACDDVGYLLELAAEAVRRGLAEDPERRARAYANPWVYRA